MGFLGDFVKIIFYMMIASWILVLISFFMMGQTELAISLLIGFIIPLSMIIYAYLTNRKKHNLTESS